MSLEHVTSRDANPKPTREAIRSAVYTGRVTHNRLRPRRHKLGYRVFYLLLDLDEIPELSARLRVFSHGRFNILAFHDRDHGDGSATPLRVQIESVARRAGVRLDGGRIRLLCLPRILGYVFNPLSVYFCDDRAGNPACIVYEVSNTFGQRHSYVIPVDRGRAARLAQPRTLRQTCAKAFYVSPFLDMDLTYDFEIQLPAERLSVAVLARDDAGPILATSFVGIRHPLTDQTLGRMMLTHPLLTLKVVAGIHWEALAIWLKGIRLRPRPPEPRRRYSVIERHQTIAADVD